MPGQDGVFRLYPLARSNNLLHRTTTPLLNLNADSGR
jgi:hypothetical protein